MATSDQPDHLERVLTAMPLGDRRELTLHMAGLACDYFSELAKALTDEELRRKAADGSLLAESKQLSAEHFDENMRRWLIAHGYL